MINKADKMEIPFEKLNPDTLNAIIQEMVTREGTDYGEKEFSLEDKIKQVKAQLKSGKAAITYDEESETCNIIMKDSLR